MERTRVKDIMVSLDDYPVVGIDATMYDAVVALQEAQKRLPPGRQPHRAVLVRGADGTIVGKVGQLAFLKGLEPNYDFSTDAGALERAGVGDDLIITMQEHARYFQESLDDVCSRAGAIKVKTVLQPVEEGLDENALLGEALHKIVRLQRLSLLVMREGSVVGIMRLSDLFETITEKVIEMNS